VGSHRQRGAASVSVVGASLPDHVLNGAKTFITDARVSRIYGGSSEIMKIVIAKDLGL